MQKAELTNYVPKNRIPADLAATEHSFTVSAQEWEYYFILNVYQTNCGELLYTTFLDQHHGDWITWDVQNRKWLTCMVDKYQDCYGLVGEFACYYKRNFRYQSDEAKDLWKDVFPGDKDLLRRIYQWQKAQRAEGAELRYKRGQEKIERLFETCKPLPKDFERWIANNPMKKYRYMYYKKTDRTHYTGVCTHCGITVYGDCKTGNLRDTRGRCPNCHSAVTFTPIGNTAAHNYTEWVYVLDQGKEPDSLILSQYRVFWKFHRGDPRDLGNEPYHSVELNGRCIIDRYGRTTYYFREYTTVAGRIRKGWAESGCSFREGWVYKKSLSRSLTGRWEHCAAKYTNQDTLNDTVGSIFVAWIKTPVLEALAKAGHHRILRDYLCEHSETRELLDLYRTEVSKALRVKKSSARALREVDGGWRLLKYCQMEESKGRCPDAGELRMASLFCTNFRFATVCENANMGKWLPWAVRTCRKEKLNPKDFASDYNDYLRDLDFLKLTGKEYLFPKNFSEMHLKTADEVAEIKDKGVNEGILKAAKEFSKIFELQKGDYIALLPRKAKDLRAEGRALHHCVGGYAARVADKSSIIVFVRKATAPEKSLATAEFKKDGRCFQFRAFSNKDPDKQTREWFEDYKKIVKKKLEEQERERIKRKNRRRDRRGDQSDQTADGTESVVCIGGDRQTADRSQSDGAPRRMGAVAV